MLTIMNYLLLLLPITLYAAPAIDKFDVGGVSLGTHKVDILTAIPKAKCTIKSNTVEVCEIGSEEIDDAILANTKGLVTFLLDKNVVEIIVVKVPFKYHEQIKSALQARLGSFSNTENSLWSISGDIVNLSPSKDKVYGGYIVSR